MDFTEKEVRAEFLKSLGHGDIRRASSDYLWNKEYCVSNHERMRQSVANLHQLPSGGIFTSIMSIHTGEQSAASALLSKLKVITLPELVVDKHHRGRVLYGRFCVRPFRINSINTVLEDEAGSCVRVTIYNVVVSTASLEEIEARFPLGMRVAIKEPFFKYCADGKTAVRVDNPADICVDEKFEDESYVPDSSDCDVMELLEKIRSEGNSFFAQKKWVLAVQKYSQCIDRARNLEESNLEESYGKVMKNTKKLQGVVMLTYSNRAEARLRLESYEEALSDAVKALEWDPQHMKSLVRKGKAAHSLGLYAESCKAFRSAMELNPREQSIVEALQASTISYKQAEHGIFDLTDYFSNPTGSGSGRIMSFADYMGPVEIRRSECCDGGQRGLFATRNVEAGELLLVSNPLASVRVMSDVQQLQCNLNHSNKTAGMGSVSSGSQEDLVTKLASLVMGSKRKMAQLYSLLGDEKKVMPIPSMELFRPGTMWVPPDAGTLEVDISRIRSIAKQNAFGTTSENFVSIQERLRQKGLAPSEVFLSLQLLPSFMNHSCSPCCSNIDVGDAMLIRATREIRAGEELTIPYFDVFKSVEGRQEISEHWSFTCKCKRCLLERTLKRPFSKISDSIPGIVSRVKVENRQGGKRALKELSQLVDEIEELILSQEALNLPECQAWIRASFFDAYLSKFKLAQDQRDVESKISALRVIVDTIALVSMNELALEYASMLLLEIERKYLKHSLTCRLTYERVLGMYRIVYGKQTNELLDCLMRSRRTGNPPSQ